MKKIVCLVLGISLLLLSCNDKKPKLGTTGSGKQDKEAITVDDKTKNTTGDLDQKKEELEKLIPLTSDQLTTMIPAELMGGARTSVDVNNSMGTMVAEADYKINDSTDLKLEIVDCAGPGGSGMFGIRYMNMIDVNSDDEDEYVKTINLNGQKAFENCKKKRSRCTITYFDGRRFLISIQGDNIGIDALKDLAKNLHIR